MSIPIPTHSANMALYKRWITLLKKYLNTKSVNYILWFHDYIQWILNDTTFNSLFDLYNNLDKRSINSFLTTSTTKRLNASKRNKSCTSGTIVYCIGTMNTKKDHLCLKTEWNDYKDAL